MLGKQSLEGGVTGQNGERDADDAVAEATPAQLVSQLDPPLHYVRPPSHQVARSLPRIGTNPPPKPAKPVVPPPLRSSAATLPELMRRPTPVWQTAHTSIVPEHSPAPTLTLLAAIAVDVHPINAMAAVPAKQGSDAEPAIQEHDNAPPAGQTAASLWSTPEPGVALPLPTILPQVKPRASAIDIAITPPLPALPSPPSPGSKTAPPQWRPSLPSGTAWRFAKKTLRLAALAFAGWIVAVLTMIALLRFIDPPYSMLMVTKRLSGETLQHEWVPLDKVSTGLRRAVVTSEDSKFCRHWGFDLGEIRAAMRAGDRFGRGASTITQQVAKNLFLWPGKSYVRKALEVPLTLAIEATWSKRRILEIYLNVAEWGPGIFGAQAAAQYYFNKPVSSVTDREAALLAVSLPNPIARDASDPDPRIERRAATLQSRMRVAGISYCVLGSAARKAP